MSLSLLLEGKAGRTGTLKNSVETIVSPSKFMCLEHDVGARVSVSLLMSAGQTVLQGIAGKNKSQATI